MADFVEVVAAGNGWTQVRDAEGNVFKLEGARNWRNNNPGNLEYGEFAKSLGAVGSDGRFAVFPSYDAGRQAKERLIFASPSYRDLTLEQAISRYAPPNENNTRSYINQVAAAAGVPASTPMNQIPTTVRGNVLNAMERVEGFKPGRTYNAQGIPLPPAEIPNVVASALSVTQPRVAPNPATQSPDLAQMRNPIMSSSARNAQVTPSSNVPLPRPRPSAPDIVTPTMASLNAQRPNVNASRAGDMLAASKTPYTPRLTDAGDNIYSYHIPDMTPTAIVGGIGSLTPSPARQRLPDIPRTIPGQSQIERAAANVRPAAPAASPSTVAPAQNMLSRDSVANAALGQRVATQMGQAFNPPENIPTRLVPKPIVQPTNVTRNQPPIQVVPAPQPQMRSAPVPALMSQGLAAQRMPLMGSQQMGGGLPLMRSQPVSQSPLRVTVSGANSYSSPAATPVQSLQRQGLSDADAYALANQQSRERAYERVNGPDTRSDWFRDVTGG